MSESDRPKLSEDELKELSQRELLDNPHCPDPGDIYLHYKGGFYTVLAVSLDESTLEPLVTYRSNKYGTRWTRTLKCWGEAVARPECPGSSGPRFERVQG